jgi:hypothetical protein
MELVWKALEAVWRGSRGFQGGSIGGWGGVCCDICQGGAIVHPLAIELKERTFGHAYHSHPHLS